MILFCKIVITNQMSFLFVEFNFCPEKQESQIVKITPSWLSRVDMRIEISRSVFFRNKIYIDVIKSLDIIITPVHH